MNRRNLIVIISIGLLLILPLTVAVAQEETEEPDMDIVATPEVDPTPRPTPEEVDFIIQDQETPQELLINARLDLELLTTLLGVERPEGWSGSLDIEDPQLPILVRLDLELLAGVLLGSNTRPEGWFGVVASSPYFIARDIRHDLELLANQVIDPANGMPENWLGGEPIVSCDRSTQALVQFLEMNGVFALDADPAADNFCEMARTEASLFVELNFLEEDPTEPGGILTDGGLVDSAAINSNFAVGFFDRNANGRAGLIPNGTPIQPLGRSYVQYSSMMLIQGEDFEVFVDFQFTTVSEDEFDALPNVDDLTVETTCTADWCDRG